MRTLPLLLLALAVGCPGPCPVPDHLASGEAEAEIDGDAWRTEGGTWMMAGESLQGTLPEAGGWQLTFVLQQTRDGLDAPSALDAGAFSVALGESTDGGWAVLRGDAGTFSTDAEHTGVLWVAEVTDDALLGCLDFVAVGDGGEVTVEAGGFHLPRL